MENSEISIDESNNALTPEQETKSNRDLRTISAITKILENTYDATYVVVGGGYASEAHCGGVITRPHGDIDLSVYSRTPIDNAEVDRQIEGVLKNESNYTDWVTYPYEPEKRVEVVQHGHIEYREAKNNHKPFPARRRVEASVYEDRYPEKRYEQKTLLDSEGEEYQVKVVSLSYLIAEKVQRLFEVMDLPPTEQEKFGRATIPSDFSDIKRLISVPDFTEDKKKQAIQVIGRRLNRGLPDGAPQTDPVAAFEKVVAQL